MAITDYKITDGEITQRNVKSAPDVLSDTPNNNKAVFDNLTEHFIGKYNDLIDNINSDFVDSSEFAEGLTVTDKVRWRYALTKGTSIGLNFSGNITQITTGFRTIVGDIDNLTETDFMDCYLSINGTDYECGDSYTSGNSILTSAVINGVTVDIIYDTTNGNITLEHATNPLDTFYWNVSIYRSVAEKVPRKALPADISNDGYTELSAKVGNLNWDNTWEVNGPAGIAGIIKVRQTNTQITLKCHLYTTDTILPTVVIPLKDPLPVWATPTQWAGSGYGDRVSSPLFNFENMSSNLESHTAGKIGCLRVGKYTYGGDTRYALTVQFEDSISTGYALDAEWTYNIATPTGV